MNQETLLLMELNSKIEYIRNSYLLSLKTKKILINKALIDANTLLAKIKGVKRNFAFQTKRALLVGCNYNNTENQLFGCIDDVHNVKELLEKQCNFTQITIMTDNTSMKPNKQNILNQFIQLLTQTNENDTAFFQFSGHGMGIMDNNGDETDGQDELIVPLGALSIMDCIIDDEFRSIIDKYLKKGAKLIALFDCCHSGSILDLKYTYGQSDQNVESTNGDVFMISGCADNQESMDTVGMFNGKALPSGAMTFAFLNTIKPNASQSIESLILDMNRFLKNNGYRQLPKLCYGKQVDVKQVSLL